MTGERLQPTPPPASGALRVLAALSLVAALAIPLVSFACLFPLVENMPTWDQWSLVELWIAHYEGRPVLPLMLKPYNGHLNLVPRLVFFVLGVMSHWNVRLDVVASYVAACGTLALLLLLARRSRQGLLLAAPISAQVFSFLQYENFISGYPFGQNLSQFLSTLAVFLLSLPRLSRRAFLGAAAATAAATFSWGAGLAAWYVGLLALLVRPDRSRRRLGVWAALTLLATVAVKMGATGGFRPIAWGQLVPFFLALIGKAWTPVGFPSHRMIIYLGAGALLAFAVLAAWAFLKRRWWPEMLPWLLLGLSALASAGLIALGRGGEGFDQSLASHYVTATYPLVVACLALLFLLLQAATARSRAAWTAVALVIVAAPVLQAAVVSSQWLPVLRSWNPTVHRNVLAIARGTATDEEIRRSHHPEPRLVRDSVEVMRRHRLAWFHDALDGEAPAGNVDRLARQTIGQNPVVIEVDEPWRIEGWAVRSRNYGGPVKGVYLYIDGRRIAAAELDLPRTDVMAYFNSSAAHLDSGWIISVPPSTVAEGPHHLWVAAADFNDGLFTLGETEIVARRGGVPPPGQAAP